LKTKKYPLISIIVSNYNGAKLNTLQECLQNFKKVDYSNFEFLLVDNASTDDSVKVAGRIFGDDHRFKIIKNPINMYSQGVNLAFQQSRGEYIALFNNDIELKDKYLHKLLAAFSKYPKLAIAQGKLLWALDHKIIDSAGESIDIYGNPVTLGYQTTDIGQYNKDEEILSATGAACLIKKSVLLKVGLYDPEYGIGYEDMDHSLRFRQMGFKIMRIKDAVCFHKRAVTDSSVMVKVKVRWHFNKNRLSTMIRNYPLVLLLKSLPITLIIYLFTFVWDMLINQKLFLALTRPMSVIWVIKSFPRLITARQRIRQDIGVKYDKEIISLFSKTDLIGKIKAVVLDKFTIKKIQYTLPWTYPAEIKKLIPTGSTVLDVGCGDGHLMSWVNYRGEYFVTGVDINNKDLQVASNCRTLVGKIPVFKNFIKGDITKKLFAKEKFDVVLCSQTIEHLSKSDALKLITKLEKLAKKRVILATINGFFQFNHRKAGKYDVHLSGWKPADFQSMGYSVQGHGFRLIYKPGLLKDISPKFLNPALFLVSYLSTPFVRVFYPAALLLIAWRDINEKT